jgi:hypothetical protein
MLERKDYRGQSVICERPECGHVGEAETIHGYLSCRKCSTTKIRIATACEVLNYSEKQRSGGK